MKVKDAGRGGEPGEEVEWSPSKMGVAEVGRRMVKRLSTTFNELPWRPSLVLGTAKVMEGERYGSHPLGVYSLVGEAKQIHIKWLKKQLQGSL
jgi:hypothetical protein